MATFTGNPRTGSVMAISHLHVDNHSKSPGGGEGEVKLQNDRIARDKADVLYHLGLSNIDRDLQKMFSDVKFVCMGGSADRMKVTHAGRQQTNGL